MTADQPRPSAANLLAGLGLLFVIVLAVTASIVVDARRKSDIFDAATELRSLDLLLSGETQRSFQSVRLVLDGVADQLQAAGPLSGEILAERASKPAVHADLRARLSGLPQLDAVTIVGADGRILNYSRAWPVKYWNLADRPYFVAASRTPGAQPMLSQPLVDRFTKEPTIYLVRRLEAANGRFVGIVIGAVKITYFNRFYESLHLATGEFIALRRADGQRITQFPAGNTRKMPEEPGHASAGRHGVQGVFDVNYAGVDGANSRNIVASTATTDLGIRVEIGRAEDGVLSAWRSEALTVAITVAFVALLLGLIFWALTRRWVALEIAAKASAQREQALLAQRDLEDALMHAQKMDAIGQLAGGIAHDFNNMLAVISGCLELLRRKIGDSQPALERCLANSEEGVRRATALTSRLLCFARKEQVHAAEVEVNRLVGGLLDLLDRTIGGGVSVRTRLSPTPCNVWADTSQLENALLNLCVNARDAMPGGGAITITTSNVDLAQGDIRAIDLPAGSYIELAIADTGSGMSPDVVSRIFEPFFTTKGVGRGTGLGLSQVFAFVRDAKGAVKVDSELGEGTTFRIYLPRVEEKDALVT